MVKCPNNKFKNQLRSFLERETEVKLVRFNYRKVRLLKNVNTSINKNLINGEKPNILNYDSTGKTLITRHLHWTTSMVSK